MNKRFKQGDFVFRKEPGNSTGYKSDCVIIRGPVQMFDDFYYIFKIVGTEIEGSAWDEQLEYSEIMQSPLMKALG